MEDDDAAMAYNEEQRYLAIENINALQTKEVTVKISKFRKRKAAHARLWAEYFFENPIYPDSDFRRRFRMHRPLFNRILEAVCTYDNYFVQREDAAHRLGLSPHQKIIAALRHICYGACADIWGEYLAIGESTAIMALKRFSHAIVQIFGNEHLRSPTSADVERLSAENTARGFPGMLGSIDCIHWQWKNCHVVWQGAYRGHKKLLQDLLHGRTPPINYQINGNHYNMGYYLADGIYPRYATIVKSMKNPNTEKERVFSKAQESVRNDVERAFGILQARFAITRQPGRLWNEAALSTIIQSCLILHNMIVEDERRVNWPCEYDQIEELPELHRNSTIIFNNYIGR